MATPAIDSPLYFPPTDAQTATQIAQNASNASATTIPAQPVQTAQPTTVSGQLSAAQAAQQSTYQQAASDYATYSAQSQQALGQQQQYVNELGQVVSAAPNISDLTAGLNSKYDVDTQYNTLLTNTNQMGTYLQQVADLQQQEANDLQISGNRLASKTFILGEQAAIQQRYESRIANAAANANALAAVNESIRGNITVAQTLITQAVNAATYDYQIKVDGLKDLISANSDLYNSLSTKEKNALDVKLQIEQTNLQQAQADKTEIGNLMITYPDAGINLNMSLDDARKLAASSAAKDQALARQQAQANIAYTKAQTATTLQQAQANIAYTKAQTATTLSGRGETKAPTQFQTESAGYYLMMKGAEVNIEDAIASGARSGIAQFSGADKKLRQAASEFINALLRRQSGATISDSEYANYSKTYFPHIGDSQEVIDQKAESRQRAIDSLANDAGMVSSTAMDIYSE